MEAIETGLRCHCPKGPEGHPPSTAGCKSRVPTRKERTFRESNPGGSVMATEIFTALAQHNPARRDQLLRSAAVLKASEAERLAQERSIRACLRVKEAESKAGSTPTKRQAAELLKAQEALPVQLHSARQLRWDNLL